ncbi:fatty acid 2-hydroxylase isoform X2 [Lasioglossum baleicum]|uniref:fatty acid 2-hydroxylase isoform X2 n=1 Tax=Lasioglossum baleicum TaxID=434251 RepID=UPI003FCDAE4C
MSTINTMVSLYRQKLIGVDNSFQKRYTSSDYSHSTRRRTAESYQKDSKWATIKRRSIRIVDAYRTISVLSRNRFGQCSISAITGEMSKPVMNGDRRPAIDRLTDRSETGEDEFLVNYRNRSYNISKFLRYHPGGKRVFGHFENRSLDKAFEENPHSKAAFHMFEEFSVNAKEKYQEYEDLIDWDAPILGQVGELGDRYWEWANLPVNREIRMFKSSLLEILSITPWYLIPIVWVPVCIYFLCCGLASMAGHYTGHALAEAFAWYGFGILMWTILEYVLHRKLFHFKPPATSRLLISLHFILHGVHHKAPFDNRRLVFPPGVGLLIAKLVWNIYQVFFPSTVVYFLAAGTTTGYLCYDLIHYYLHHGAPKSGSYFYTLKRNHNYHHFSHHELGFGISSKLWDHAFGTNIYLRQLTKPIEW